MLDLVLIIEIIILPYVCVCISIYGVPWCSDISLCSAIWARKGRPFVVRT